MTRPHDSEYRTTKGKWFIPQVTAGHIVQIFVAIFTVMGFWIHTDRRITTLEMQTQMIRHDQLKVQAELMTAVKSVERLLVKVEGIEKK